jgi:hypothetical protein
MALIDTGSLLVITPLSGQDTPVLAPYSTRAATHTYEVLNSAGGQNSQWLRRDVNAVLRSVADTRFRKYNTTISCRDSNAPCLDNSWIGIEVEVQCAFEFSFPTGGTPGRPVLSGSEREEGGITFYRPILYCLVASIKNSFEEWAAFNAWNVELPEI